MMCQCRSINYNKCTIWHWMCGIGDKWEIFVPASHFHFKTKTALNKYLSQILQNMYNFKLWQNLYRYLSLYYLEGESLSPNDIAKSILRAQCETLYLFFPMLLTPTFSSNKNYYEEFILFCVSFLPRCCGQ